MQHTHQPEHVSNTANGVNISVHFNDGRPPEVLEVRKPLPEVDPALAATDVSSQAQKYTGKSPEYVHALTDDSIYDILIMAGGLDDIFGTA